MTEKRRYYKELRLSQLRAITELQRQRSFAGVAAVLELATPSVWQQIRGMEDDFGVPLVEVNGQQVTLTAQGRLLAELSEPVVQGFDAIREQFTQQAAAIPRRLTIAGPGNVLVNELPAPLRRYCDEHPDVELSLIDTPSNPARRMLEEGEVDLAVVGQLDTSFPSTLAADEITSFPFMLVCSPDHPVLSLQRIGPKSLARFPLVMSSLGTNTRRRVDEVFAAAGVRDRLRIVFETSTKELLLQYVRLNFGIAVVPISTRYQADSNAPYGDVQNLCFRDVSSTFGHEHIVILRRRHRREPAFQQAFRDIVRNSLQESD